MAVDILTTLQSLGIEQILLFLLSFAVVYGLLKQYKIPKSKSAQAMIGLAIAFLVIMAAPVALVNVLKEMSANLILVAVGILVLIIFLEVAGIGATVTFMNPDKPDKEGNPTLDAKKIKIFERYGYAFAIVLGIIAVLIFINAGGLGLIGLGNVINLSSSSTTTIIFFIVILLAIFWLISEKG